MTQPTLFEDDGKHRTAAIKWMARNPAVVKMFESFALAMLMQKRRFGINLLRERVRWECIYQYDEEFKFCNTFSPYLKAIVSNTCLVIDPERNN